MDKTLTFVNSTGQVKTEIFTIRLCVPKSMLRQACGTIWELGDYKKLFHPISFDQGILAGISNTFELIFISDLSTIQMNWTTVKNSKAERVEFTGMNISFMVDGVVHHSAEMTNNKRQQHFSLATNDSIWGEAVNEVKIDITVTRHSKLEFVMSETFSTFSAAGQIPNNRGLMDVSKYFMSNDLSDVSIKCENETFPAHLFILGHNSEVFTKMFEHEMKEKKNRCVEIKDFSSKAVLEMLRFLYTSKVENMDGVVPYHLYELGDRYMIEPLKTLVADFLTKTVNIDNTLEIYYFSRKHNIGSLTEVAKKVLHKNRKQLITSYNGLVVFMDSVPDDARDDLFNLLMG